MKLLTSCYIIYYSEEWFWTWKEWNGIKKKLRIWRIKLLKGTMIFIISKLNQTNYDFRTCACTAQQCFNDIQILKWTRLNRLKSDMVVICDSWYSKKFDLFLYIWYHFDRFFRILITNLRTYEKFNLYSQFQDITPVFNKLRFMIFNKD